MKQEARPIRSDILSADEECALSLVREIVAGIRARSAAMDLGFVEQALENAGASKKTNEAVESEFRMFSFRSARFSVETGLHTGTGIEVNFDPEWR